MRIRNEGEKMREDKKESMSVKVKVFRGAEMRWGRIKVEAIKRLGVFFGHEATYSAME